MATSNTKVIKEIITDVGGNTTIEYSDDTTQKYNAADVVTAQSNPLTGGISLLVGSTKLIAYASPNTVGDGVANDTAAIQAALDYVGSFPLGGKLMLPPGIYKTTNTLRVPSSVALEGAGIGRTVIRTSGAQFVGYTHPNGNTSYAVVAMQGAKNASVRHLTADLFTGNTSANGITIEPGGKSGFIYSDNSSECVIDSCEVLGALFHEYLLWNQGGKNCKITNNFVDGSQSVPAGTEDQVGIEVYGGTNIIVSGNTVKNCEGYGIAIGSNIGFGGDGMVTSGIVVCNNFVDNCNKSILLQGHSDVARSATWKTSNVSVYSNSFTRYRNTAIHIYSAVAGSAGGGDKLSDINVSNNFIDSQGITGVLAVDLQLPISEDFYRGIKINANTFVNTLSSARAIKLQYPINLTMDGNHILNSNLGLMIVIGAKDVSIARNIFSGYVGKIEVQASTRLRIVGNRFSNGLTNTTQTIAISSASFFTEIVENAFDTLNNYPHVLDVAGSDYTRVSGNVMNYANTTNAPYQLNGTNINFGKTAVLANAATTVNAAFTNGVGTPAVNTQNTVSVTQIAGPVTAFKVTHTTTGFTITCGTASDGTTQFAWERY